MVMLLADLAGVFASDFFLPGLAEIHSPSLPVPLPMLSFSLPEVAMVVCFDEMVGWLYFLILRLGLGISKCVFVVICC